MKETSWSEILSKKLDEIDWKLIDYGLSSVGLRSEEGVGYKFYIFENASDSYKPYLSSVEITKRCYKHKKRLFEGGVGLKSIHCSLDEEDFSKVEWKMLGKKALAIYKNFKKGEAEMLKKQEKDTEDEMKNYILKEERGK